LSTTEAGVAVETLREAPLWRIPHQSLLTRIWELRANVTTADAAYIAMAEALSVPLLTADARLTRAPGTRCEFELID
jgi:predicted nucleic acid-binding protein